MIDGIGVDVVDVDRITPLNMKLAQKILTESELQILHSKKNEKDKILYFGGRFAAKEAFAKAFGTGFIQMRFEQLEILPDELGKPIMTFTQNEALKIHVSISHSENTVIAFVVIEKET